MARVKSGEIGVHYEGREYVFRPSFARLDSLSQDHDLNELWNDLVKGKRADQEKAATVILAYLFTGSESDLETLIGHTMPVNGWRWDVPGVIPTDEQCIIAFSLLRNGLVGNEHFKAKKSDGSSGEKFNAYDFVFSAVKSLGMSMDEAKELTMAEFQQAMLIAYPDHFIDIEREEEKNEALLKAVGIA